MKNIIFDFDGTLTDIEKSSADWQKKYPKVCAEMLGANYIDIKNRYFEIKNDLINQNNKGFIIAGYNSLPASSDPYIKSQAAMIDLIKEDCGKNFETPKDITKFLINSFSNTNKISQDKTFFRDGAEDFLNKVKKNYRAFIITNSDGDKTISALQSISHDDIEVYGNAKKLFVNSENISCLFPNFPRITLLDRKEYTKILKDLQRRGIEPEETIVVGDIFELDLAIPTFLGYDIIQIDNGSTPKHEKNYMKKNHHFVNDLNELEQVIL